MIRIITALRVKKSIWEQLLLIKAIIGIPAWLIHEMSHIVMAILFWMPIEVTEWVWFRIDRDENGTVYNIKAYSLGMSITYSATFIGNLCSALCCIAPTIAVLLIALYWPYSLIYFLFCVDVSTPSSTDIETFKNNIRALITGNYKID